MTSTATPTERDQPLPAPDDPHLGAREQIRWFGLLWLVAMVAHHTDGVPNVPTGAIPVIVLALPLLVWPSSGAALLLLVGGVAVQAAMALPGIANHMVLALLVGIGFGLTSLYVLVLERRSPSGTPFGVRLFSYARTPIGLTLVVVYAFTTFHKLNTAFFDPVNSCATHLMSQLFNRNGLPEPGLPPFVLLGSAVGTIIVETAIVVCFAVPKLRRFGLPLGVGFHGLLAWASFYDFAAAVYALYLLLIPTSAFAAVAKRAPNLPMWSLIAFFAHVLLAFTTSLSGTEQTSFGLHWHTVLVVTWFLAVWPVMLLLCRAVWTSDRRTPFPGWSWKPAVLLLIPVLAFVNGATAYVGLKTVANYSMFSNLHTENGQSNHLIPGISALQVFHYQDDPVTVLSMRAEVDTGVVNPKWMREQSPQVVPLQELRRLTQLWKDAGLTGDRAVAVRYERAGRTVDVPDAVADPVLGAPMPWWERKLMSFRALTSPEGPDICRW
jgi:hypothetical protein